MTDWYPPEIRPIRSGLYQTSWFDAGWDYQELVHWDNDRRLWRDADGGWSLIDQNVTWRGLTENADANNG